MMGLIREGIQMDQDDYAVYYVPAMQKNTAHFDLDFRMKQIAAFDKLLGVSMGDEYSKRARSYDEPIPDDWRQFLTQLAGPYGKSLLKAYRIKNKLEKAEHQNVKQD